MKKTDRKWNENETTLCLGLYYLYSSGVVSFEEGVQSLGAIINRSRGSVGFKLGNLTNCDNPNKGFENGSKLDSIIFHKYAGNIDNLFLDIKRILSLDEYRNCDTSILLGNNPYSSSTPSYNFQEKENLYIAGDNQTSFSYSADDKESMVRVREKQWAFRTSLLTNYDNTCCISGIKEPRLLIASHIVPWADDKTKRLDPANGLLLNSLLDRAFDQGLITFHPTSHSLIISDKIKDEKTLAYLSPFDGSVLTPPRHLSATPSKENLQYHNDVIFNHFSSDKDNTQYILYQ